LRSDKENTQASHRFHFRTYVLPVLGARRLNTVEKEETVLVSITNPSKLAIPIRLPANP